jgi:hypothetical protein
MNFAKPIAITASILINAAVLVWFHAWSVNAVASATSPSHADKIMVLPTITVHPSTAQLRALRHAHGSAAPVQAVVVEPDLAFDMPYYSFAARSAVTAKG